MESNEFTEIRKEIQGLQKELSDLRNLVQIQINRIWKLEQGIKTITPQKPIPTPKPVETITPPKIEEQLVPEIKPPIVEIEKPKEPISPQPEKKEFKEKLSSIQEAQKQYSESIKQSKESREKYTLDLEAKIGGNWLSKIGIFTLFLGLAFLFKYAFEHGWITEVMRVAIGVLTGLTLLSLGEYFHAKNKYLTYARVMTGGGIAFLYLSFYAAYGFYHLVNSYASLGLMLLTTVTAIFFSQRYKNEVIGIIGCIGGYLTPILLMTGHNEIILYLSYSFILTLGMIFECYREKWKYVFVLGIIGGYLLPVYLIYNTAGYVSYLLIYYLIVTGSVFWVTTKLEWEEMSYLGVIGGYLMPPLAMTSSSDFSSPLIILTFYLILTAGILLCSQVRKWQIFSWLGLFFAYIIPAYLLRGQTTNYLWILAYYFLITAGIVFSAYSRKWKPTLVLGTLGGYLLPLYLIYNTPGYLIYLLIYYLVITGGIIWATVVLEWEEISYLGLIGGFLIPSLAISGSPDVNTPLFSTPVFTLTFYLILTAGILLFSRLRKWQIFTWIGLFLSFLIPAYLVNTQMEHYLWVLGYYFLITVGILVSAYFREWKESAYLGLAGGIVVPLFLLFDKSYSNFHILVYFGILTLISYFITRLKKWDLLALIGLIGGYAGPLILAPSYNYQSETFPYLLILGLLSIGIAFLDKWQPLIYFAYILNTAFIYYWGGNFYNKSLMGISETWLVVFFLLFHIGSSLNSWIKKEKFNQWDIFLQLLIAASYFTPTYWMMKPEHPYWPGYIAIILVFYYLLNALITYRVYKEDVLLSWNQVGLASVFAALAIPILLEQQWITIGWSIEAVVLTWIGLKGKNEYLRAGGLVLLVGVVIRLFFYDRIDLYYPQKDFVLIFNRRFLAFLSGILSTYGILYLLQKNKELVEEIEKNYISLGLAILANFLSLWVLSVETLDFINNRFWTWKSNPMKSKDLWMMKQMALSCLWAVYSIILVSIGMWKKSLFTRIFAIALFGITIFKVFLIDLSYLTGISRIASFIVLGIILLLVSYMYQRFQEKLKVFLTQNNPTST